MVYTVREFLIFTFHTNINQTNKVGNNKCKALPITIFKHSQSQNRLIRAVLLVAFRRVPVCISVADTYLYLHLLLFASPVHWRPHPVFTSHAATIKEAVTKSGLCSQVRSTHLTKKEIQSHHSGSLYSVQLRDENDIHSRSTGSSAGQGPRRWYQPECCKVLPAGLWHSAGTVSEERMPVWGRQLSSWTQITGLQWTGTILIQDQGGGLEKTNSKELLKRNTQLIQ